MDNDPANSSGNPNGNTDENIEWQLADLVDAIASEIDRAQDTLSLKSYARGLSFAIKKLSLDLEVKVRRTTDGKLLFRTVSDDQTSTTVLKLDFAQVLQSQLTNVRKPLDGELSAAGVSAIESLSDITPENIAALGAIGIYSVDDLERYTQTPLMIAELSRKTRIDDVKIRMWQQLPYIREVKPESGTPGSIVVIEGDNFGNQRGLVLFQKKHAEIIDWRGTRLSVKIPSQVNGSDGFLVVQSGDQITNTVSWTVTGIDLCVNDILVSPSQPIEGDEITVKAALSNQGTMDANPFEVQWEIDGQKQELQSHGPLRSKQSSEEGASRRHLKLSAGSHIIGFIADPAGQLPDINRRNGTFSKQVVVRALNKLTIGDFQTITVLNPLFNTELGPADVLSLIFRGIGRLDPETGKLVMDIATSWENRANNGEKIFVVGLADNVQFHDGTLLTAEDVGFTYKMAIQQTSPWSQSVMDTINGIKVIDNNKIAFRLLTEAADRLQIESDRSIKVDQRLAKLLTLGILPRSYKADPEEFNHHPIGSGPFQLKDFVPGDVIRLNAFSKYIQGKPRLDQINISMVLDENLLLEMINAHKVDAAVVPYSEQLESQLRTSGEWKLEEFRESPSPQLCVQSLRVYERLPNAFNTNWNAHLWYLKS